MLLKFSKIYFNLQPILIDFTLTHMKLFFAALLIIFRFNYCSESLYADTIQNKNIIEKPFPELKTFLLDKYSKVKPGKFGEFVKGSHIKLDTDKKIVALTLDACGGYGSNGYNSALIELLRKEKIPATLFVSGKWINANAKTFEKLAADTLFEIDNHGDKHKICTITGATVYDIVGTKNVSEVIDEIEINAQRILQLTGRRPYFFRSATAFIDEASVNIASDLDMQVVSYSVLSGDGVPAVSDTIIYQNIVRNTREGSIIIMHFNHPQWNEKEGLKKAIPILRKKGFSFVKLQDYNLLDKFEVNERMKRK